jgi:acyl carrier protein
MAGRYNLDLPKYYLELFMTTEATPSVPTQWPASLRPELIEPMLDIFADRANIDRDRLVPGMTMESLSIPSLDMVDVLFEIEERFGIYMPMGDELSGAVYLADLVGVIAQQIEQGKAEADLAGAAKAS